MSIEYLNSCWQKANAALKDSQNFRKPILYFRNNREQNIRLDFSTNDYLGIRHDARIIESGYCAAMRNGAGTASSRMVLQTDDNLLELEDYFSKSIGLAYSLYFSSGFMANIALFDALSTFMFDEENLSQELFVDHRCHASIYLGFRNSKIKSTIFRHLDFENLEQKLKQSSARAKIIVIESLFSMDGDYFDAVQLNHICEKYNANIIIDETHSIGLQRAGSYLAEHIFLKKYIIAIVSGCGKALGVAGGFISTDYHELKLRIMQKAKPLIYSTAAPPFVVGALLQSLKIIFSDEGDCKRIKLIENIEYLKNKILCLIENNKKFCLNINDLKVHRSHIFPIIFGENLLVLNKVSELLKCGILVKEIRPPSVPRGTARLRVILRSDHSKRDIDELLENIV
ncbi:aminotransferase class I/II-fold pyridoxal phosphate-dependent enzyme [Fluviispira multicolorata]|uniref:Aminotransferase class I/II-fold pyridoxal phosphate-dependent enzyme n=1 Tax=Fluviispira multicolorata TaxID=2654512 RepID=A0A833JD89_9BACT|nr:pyridoxal phosphate-dependent aminotransferase family protein [Fluviispira multicolorata]KAB8028077.1 aminotransferase class I/II-fold pyridoxal phosphate-dependent enzyme [Fluviispira multicolorata]